VRQRTGCAALALAGLALALALGALASAAPAARASQGWAYEMANELMSPYCPGRSVADCPSPQAQTLRMWLIVQESAGRTRAEVEAELVSRYGESILGAPRARGFGLTAYLIPAAIVAAGAALLSWFLRRQTRSRQTTVPAAPGVSLDPELERLLDEKLAER
jgi:cytochrome c-type biogenesis protein CcmH/NrfF